MYTQGVTVGQRGQTHETSYAQAGKRWCTQIMLSIGHRALCAQILYRKLLCLVVFSRFFVFSPVTGPFSQAREITVSIGAIETLLFPHFSLFSLSLGSGCLSPGNHSFSGLRVFTMFSATCSETSKKDP